MALNARTSCSVVPGTEEEDLRRGPWTVEEDLVLRNYIAAHGEGKWNSLAPSAGLKRTGKSCRLRWLNYLKPDVRRGNITPEEQLLIFELHSRWGNRWSKIALHLPGRTDNEIKNYWRTKVQKHAKKLHCDVNSKQFKDVMRHLWMPRLLERIHAANSGNSAAVGASMYQNVYPTTAFPNATEVTHETKQSPETSSMTAESSLESLEMQFTSPPVSGSFAGSYCMQSCEEQQENWLQESSQLSGFWPKTIESSIEFPGLGLQEFEQNGGWEESLWSVEDIWLQQQF